MKKIIAIITVYLFAVTGNVLAQGAGKVSLQDLHFTSNLKNGENTVSLSRVTKLKITFESGLVKKVEYIDSLGVRTILNPTTGGANGVPKPECKNALPDTCFGSADKSIGLCICKPTDISGAHTFSFRKLPGRVKYPNITLR